MFVCKRIIIFSFSDIFVAGFVFRFLITANIESEGEKESERDQMTEEKSI